jgi:hypothetical protein
MESPFLIGFAPRMTCGERRRPSFEDAVLLAEQLSVFCLPVRHRTVDILRSALEAYHALVSSAATKLHE